MSVKESAKTMSDFFHWTVPASDHRSQDNPGTGDATCREDHPTHISNPNLIKDLMNAGIEPGADGHYNYDHLNELREYNRRALELLAVVGPGEVSMEAVLGHYSTHDKPRLIEEGRAAGKLVCAPTGRKRPRRVNHELPDVERPVSPGASWADVVGSLGRGSSDAGSTAIDHGDVHGWSEVEARSDEVVPNEAATEAYLRDQAALSELSADSEAWG